MAILLRKCFGQKIQCYICDRNEEMETDDAAVKCARLAGVEALE